MRSSPSPPQDAQHFRGKTLTPESPKPLHYPSPSNIPILEKQMDPMLGEPALSIGTPASYQYQQQTQTPSAHSSTSYYAEPPQNLQNAPAPGSVGAAGYSQQAAYNSATDTQAQDTTAIHNFSQQPPAASFSDASRAPAQENRSAYPYAHDANAYATQQAQIPSPNLSVSVDVQALLDQLSTPANGTASSQYAPPSMPSQPTQQGSTASTLPAAPHLPPRPPPQEKPSTHPNYNPNDDIRSFHPHSSHRGSTQLQPLNIRGSLGGSDKPVARAAVSPGASGPSPSSYAQRQPQDYSRSTSLGDDEDSRWPPEVNRMYEDFLEQERKFVTDGQWDQFPMGSRLFIGNLPTEKVTKRDIFHRFFRHGQLAQISIKQAYGFVQFMDAGSCAKALQAEQGQQVRGRKMLLDEGLPRDFIRWVEDTFQRAGLRIDVLIMSPRLNESAVVRRQIMEGVLAIIRLNTAALVKSKINVQIFDRRGGNNNVQFNEYSGLDPPTAAALVVDAKQKSSSQPVQQPAPSTYGQTYGTPAPNPYALSAPTNATNTSNLSSLISSLDPNGLSQLLGAMSNNNALQTPQAPPPGISSDLARLLGSVTTPTAAPVYNPQTVSPQQYPNSYQNSAFAPHRNGQQSQTAAPPVQTPQGTPSQAPDMAEIMAQLARYQR
ncbi:nuclear polyadenylated RNA-binding protein 3 [Kalmusia sp. IMI 367209]|nr:nuclear polyadenylated RNA-binding protein 3 [Kalmusia sp. IMI 367209]